MQGLRVMVWSFSLGFNAKGLWFRVLVCVRLRDLVSSARVAKYKSVSKRANDEGRETAIGPYKKGW